jgi:hypothetical protein
MVAAMQSQVKAIRLLVARDPACLNMKANDGATALMLGKSLIQYLNMRAEDETRVETKIFVYVFSRKFRENLFSFFAKKSYENNENFCEN